MLDPTDTTARDARDTDSNLPVACGDRPEDGDPCQTQRTQCTMNTDCCSCGCATQRSCTCDQRGVWRCTDVDRGICSVCKEDVVGVDADVPVECWAIYEGMGCSAPGTSCAIEPYCCDCGCEGGRECVCLDSGQWSCREGVTDVCFFCYDLSIYEDTRDVADTEVDSIDVPDADEDDDAVELTDAPVDATDMADVPEPDPCTGDTDCGPNAQCEPPASSTVLCQRTGDCPAGSICDTASRRCKALTCSDDAPCDTGWCIGGLCSGSYGQCVETP